MISPNVVKGDNVGPILQRAMEAGGGLLRLTPTWVPRSFLHPGRRIKLHPNDLYAYGADRGGIDERWFGSTTEAANEGRVWHEGLSFVSFEGEHFMLRDAIAEKGADIVGQEPGVCVRDCFARFCECVRNMNICENFREIHTASQHHQ